jgi:hypothetical protein
LHQGFSDGSVELKFTAYSSTEHEADFGMFCDSSGGGGDRFVQTFRDKVFVNV